MYKNILIILMMLSLGMNAMDTSLGATTGSACIVGGAALVIHGMNRQSTFVIERLASINKPHVYCQPMRIDEWLHEVAFPLFIGSTLICTGILLGAIKF